MATLVKFNDFAADRNNGVHDLSSDTIKCALSNTAPSASWGQLSEVTQISSTGTYAPATVTINSSAQSGGTYTCSFDAFSWTASGAAFDDFRYLIFYNDTATNDELIGYVDIGTAYTLSDGNTYPVAAGTLFTST